MLKILDEKLPKELIGEKALSAQAGNLNLVAQAVYVQSERSHIGMRSAKTRSEINRTTKKVYKQKGTGGARHGSRRANLFVGGGVVFGPRALRRIVSLPQSLRLKAKQMAFNIKSKEMSLVDGLDKVAKTAEVSAFLKKLTEKRYTFIISDKNLSAVKYLRNLSNCKVYLYRNITAFQILEGGKLLVDNDIFAKTK